VPLQPRKPEKLSLPQARRIALAAQGFNDRALTGAPDRRHLNRVLSRVALLQMDSVTAVVRAHYLPLFSRLGTYNPKLLEEAAWGKNRILFEYWAHEASLLPLDLQPLLRWRMKEAEGCENTWPHLAQFGRDERPYINRIFKEITQRGPTPASAFDEPKGEGGWWGWSRPKRALEWLFWAGHLTAASRKGFERVYDLPENVLPQATLAAPTPSKRDAQTELLRISARALGIATAADLRDYFRLSQADSASCIASLVESGDLIEADVEGWTKAAYLHRDATLPARITATALLAPFDPVVWERARTERLFEFRYRLEIYTPAHKRVHGYYVLPFLNGDKLAARVDLKSDKATSTLKVLAAHAEPQAPKNTAAKLTADLICMAQWLNLDRVTVENTGDFAPALKAHF